MSVDRRQGKKIEYNGAAARNSVYQMPSVGSTVAYGPQEDHRGDLLLLRRDPELGTVSRAVRPAPSVDAVLQRYEVSDVSDVKRFLTKHPELVSLLARAVPHVERIFGAGVTITLSVMSDQESAPTLSARICTAKSVDEARSLRKEFYQTWWLSAAPQEDPIVTFNVKIV